MGNQLVCCRLKWSLFTNSEDNLAVDRYDPSNYPFTNHTAFPPHIVSPVNACLNSVERGYKRLVTDRWAPTQDSFVVPPLVQHISEREPEDMDVNPSFNGACSTIFLQSFYTVLNRNHSLKKMLLLAGKHTSQEPKKTLYRWSSCGSVYIGDGCLARPDSKLIFQCVSVAVSVLLKTEKKVKPSKSTNTNCSAWSDCRPLLGAASDQSPSLTSTCDLGRKCVILPDLYKEVYELYDERIHPLFRTSSQSPLGHRKHQSPDRSLHVGLHQLQQQILHFLNRLFSSSLLTAESAIVALVYLERLISGLELHIVHWSWRRQLLSCILLACKVLDDQAVWNADYCQLLKDVHVEDLNELERHTLSLLQFNTSVPPSVYAKYYFDLLAIGDLVCFTEIRSRQRKLTVELARHFRILPRSANARAEQCSTAGESSGAGIIFDLPCPSPNLRSKNPRKRSCGSRLSESRAAVAAGVGVATYNSAGSLCRESASTTQPRHLEDYEDQNHERDLFKGSAVAATDCDVHAGCWPDDNSSHLSDYESSESESSRSFQPWGGVTPSPNFRGIDSGVPAAFIPPMNVATAVVTTAPAAFNLSSYTRCAGIFTSPNTAADPFRVSANSLLGGGVSYSILQDSGLY
uniref:Cyclin-Y n=2 Tax=Schistocephalus solidus TaxID=70667 RepID=A0A0V0J1V9_SCHSO